MIAILLVCLSFQSMQSDYYSSNSDCVAKIHINDLSFEGDSLYWAMNWIARANYKEANYRRMLSVANKIPTDSISYDKLLYDVISLKALAYKSNGKLNIAESLYIKAINSIPGNYDDLKYRAHLNYAELLRLKMDYKKRERHLLMALSYSEDREYNKVVRILTRHYFNVLLDFTEAEKMIQSHPPMDSLTIEGKAGFALLKAELAEAQQSYKRAQKFYRKADRLANKAHFISFRYEAADGFMRNRIKQQEKDRKDFQWMIINGILAFMLLLAGYYNWKRKLKK